MSLKDFMQKLQEQEDVDVIYSKPEEITTKIIPPDRDITVVERQPTTKIIAPTVEKQTTIRFKLNHTKIDVPISKVETTIEQKPKIEKPTIKYNPIEELFVRSGTEIGKKQLWLDYYEKAQASRKQNEIANRMKIGKFAITYDDQVLILPDKDVYNKSTAELLKEKWL